MNKPDFTTMTTAEYFAWNGKLASEGMARKAARGEFPGCAPLGYKNVRDHRGSRLEIDHVTAPHVRRAFEMAAEGVSIRKIAAALNAAGVRSRLGRPLGPSSVHHILGNPVYAGYLRFAGRLIKGSHEPLVSSTD